MTHFISASCEGELCSVCKAPSTHKLGEEILHDDPSNHPDPITNAAELAVLGMSGLPGRHNLTAYVCCAHFTMIVGLAAGCPPDAAMHAGILRQGAALQRENYDLRDAVIHLADDWHGQRERRAYVRALRHAANMGTVPFVLCDIDGAAASRLGDLVARCTEARGKLSHWPIQWRADIDDRGKAMETWTGKWTAINANGEETVVELNEEYEVELVEFIAWLVNTMPTMIETIERLG